MASDKMIRFRINIEKLNKEFFYVGEKGTYLDGIIFFNEEKNENGDNGFCKQSLPKDLYEKEKNLPNDQKTNMPILGNVSEIPKGGGSKNAEESPNYSKPAPGAAPAANTPATPPAAEPRKRNTPF